MTRNNVARGVARNREIIELLSDDDLIDITTTCSNRGIALAAEMHLRGRYPSKRKVKNTLTGEPAKGWHTA